MDIVPWVVTCGCAVCASATDIRSFKVYNYLTFPVFFGGLLFFLITQGWAGLTYSLAGGFIGLAILLVPYLMGGIGAGDVKFVMAIGAWIGPTALLPAILIGSLATLVYSLVLIVRGNGFREAGLRIQLLYFRLATISRYLQMEDDYETVQDAAKQEGRRGKLVPFSAMVSIGIFGLFIVEWWFKR